MLYRIYTVELFNFVQRHVLYILSVVMFCKNGNNKLCLYGNNCNVLCGLCEVRVR